MKFLAGGLLVFVCATLVRGTPNVQAKPCVRGSNCITTEGCFCSTTDSPLPGKRIPQFITLSFDDSVTDHVYQTYLERILFSRTNPDGSPISATFYVPHEYTDYTRVNDLYNKGFEIAAHSISKTFNFDYWQDATVETLTEEFYGQRQIISHFANIPIEEIIGARTPYLELAGNRTFRAYVASGIQYDNTWPSLNSRPLFPYTLDFLSDQYCKVGTCPNEAFPGVFVSPMNNLVGPTGIECNSLYQCEFYGTAEEISEALYYQVMLFYTGNRAPLTLNVNSIWFMSNENALEGFLLFLDRISQFDDLYFVAQREVISWMRNLRSFEEYRRETRVHNAQCTPRSCELKKNTEIRYMRSCVNCPKHFPWLGNPLGK